MEYSGAHPLCPPYPAASLYEKIGRAIGNEISSTRCDLLESADHLMEIIEQDQEFLPYRYSTEERMMGRDDLVVKGTGTASGFHIDGKPYSITGGVGECYLKELIFVREGKWEFGQRIDVRGKKRIVTDDWGDIKISRTKVPFTLPEELSRLIKFLKGSSDLFVRIYSYHNPSFKELLMEAADAMGADDAVMEMLHQRGDKGKKQLIDALTRKQYQEYRHIVIRFLLTMYSDEEIYQIVGHFIENLVESDEKEGYRTLFAAFSTARKSAV
jgi:hypothetical protein